MNFDSKIFIAGHRGLVGSAISRHLTSNGYVNLLTRSRAQLDLRIQKDVDEFFAEERPEYVFLGAAKVGGIGYNKAIPADFIRENLQIQTNVIDAAYRNGCKKLLFLGSACFTQDHLVYTNFGYKKIQDIKIGDKVLTHNSVFCEVYNTNIKKTNEVLVIKSIGNETITCTPDHKFLTMGGIWKEAKDLDTNDYLCISKKTESKKIEYLNIFVDEEKEFEYNKCINFLKSSKKATTAEEYRWKNNILPRSTILSSSIFDAKKENSLSYLIGVFIAEGWIEYKNTGRRGSKSSLCFSPGKNENFNKKVETAILDILGENNKSKLKKREKRTSVVYTVNSSILCQFFSQFYASNEHRAHQKIIPKFVFDLHEDAIREIIRGYWDGDGCLHKRKDRIDQYTAICASTSKELIYGIRRLLFGLDIYSSLYFVKKDPKCVIENRVVNQRNQYSLRINGKNSIDFLRIIYKKYINSSTKYKNNILSDDTYFYSKVVDIQKLEKECSVYDLTVETDHSYNVNDLIVHNCIYPKHAPVPIKEEYLMTGPLEETNISYSLAKIAGYMMCKKYTEQYGFPTVSVMPNNLYGINDNFILEQCHVIPSFINKFVTAKDSGAESVVCFGDGSPTREFLFSDDLADGLVFLMNNYENPEIINIGPEREVSIKELSEIVSRLVGYDGELIWDTSKPNGTPRRALDTSKMGSLGWKAKTSLEDGLKITIDWFLKNRSNYVRL